MREVGTSERWGKIHTDTHNIYPIYETKYIYSVRQTTDRPEKRREKTRDERASHTRAPHNKLSNTGASCDARSCSLSRRSPVCCVCVYRSGAEDPGPRHVITQGFFFFLLFFLSRPRPLRTDPGQRRLAIFSPFFFIFWCGRLRKGNYLFKQKIIFFPFGLIKQNAPCICRDAKSH